jgi:hypothetical protein
MKSPTHYRLLFLALLAASLLTTNQLSAKPIGFSELSLIVRMHESEADIKNDVAERKLLHQLTQPQEGILKSQGASDSLIQSLRDSKLVVSKEEAAMAESVVVHQNHGPSAEMQNLYPRVDVFDVAFGHPINLSRWGGLDYEIAFYSYRFAGEDHIQPALIDQIGTRTVVSPLVPTGGTSAGEAFTSNWFPSNGVRNWRFTPYNGVDYDNRGDFRDPRFNFSDSVGVASYSVSRPMAIDWRNPQFIDGQPYTFYPVYVGPGASLYFIKASSDSATVAVVPSDIGPALVSGSLFR